MKTKDLKIATIDIGSNSFLLLLCTANQSGISTIQKDVVEIVRLGQGLAKNKKFLPEALDRARNTLTTFKKMIDEFQPDIVLPKATAAARIAENRADLLSIGKNLGLEIETIPGEQEAKVTYQGVFWGQKTDETGYNLLIDIGGGSTELIVGKGANIEYSVSIPFGAVLLTERFIKSHPVVSDDEMNLEKEIDAGIAGALNSIAKFPVKTVLAVAGTPTTLVQIILGGYDDARINGYSLTLEKLLELEGKLKSRTVEQRITELGVPKGRADILYAGAVLLRKIITSVKLKEVKVSTRGVRHGIVADYFLSQH
ncbi:MAG: Ppx/GppA family phosphatase [Bdellovibrionaceae bacterium]|nr:Ppx/GppA family phosphatase [Pseudobdellovibrionaceae bacterium]